MSAQLSAELVLTKLESLQGITSKKMFGGYGIFHEGAMFGMVDSKGSIALKVDETLEAEYLKLGGVKHGKMPYYSVPQDIFDSPDLINWVERSIAVTKG